MPLTLGLTLHELAWLIHESGARAVVTIAKLARQPGSDRSSGAERTALSPHDRVLTVMPLFHASGLMNNTILPRRAGASIVSRPHFDLEEFWRVVERLRTTYFTAVPTVFARLMDAWDGRADTSSLRFVRSGAAPMAPSLQRLVEERLGVPVVLSYGLSEATCTCTMIPPHASRRD